MSAVLCPYCGQPAKLVTGQAVYPYRADLAQRKYWLCRADDAWVGTHRVEGRADQPLGRLANAELRQAKQRAHAVIDPLFGSKAMGRRETYRWLAYRLGIPKSRCHIGWFDLEQCALVIALEPEVAKLIETAP